jgi:hypothetical protein
MKRSIDLTRDRLWAVLGMSAGVMLPPLIVGAVLVVALNGWSWSPVTENPLVTNVVRPISDLFVAVWGAAFLAALYVELTRLPLIRPASAW